MKVTNGEIYQAREPLRGLLQEQWPVKTAYWLAKLTRKLNERLPVIEEVRVKLVRQYGEIKEGGGMEVPPGSPQWVEFTAAYNELMEQEEEIDMNRIVLPSDNGAKVSPAALLLLEPFIEVAE